MSLTKAEIAALIGELQSRLTGATLEAIQAGGERRFILRLVRSKKPLLLFCCLQEPFLRIHLLHKAVKGQVTPFCTALERHLKMATLQEISQLNDDRIVRLSFNAYKLLIELFAKRPNLYLLDRQDRILLSLNPTTQTHYTHPEAPQQKAAPVTLTSLEVEERYGEKEREARLERAKREHQQKIKRTQKTLQKLEKDFQDCLRWEEVQHEAELLKAHFFLLKRGLTQVEVTDWLQQDAPCTLTLDPTLEPKESVALRFKRAKKLHLGLEPLQRQIALLQSELARLNQLTDFEEIPTITKAAPPKERRLPYREFLSASGIKIWVGKDAKSNEKLTFSLARGSDFWLHVHDYPGAHVVLRSQDPDPEALQDAIQVALAHSGAKEQQSAEVLITQVKFITRLKGKAGKVQVSKHKLLHASFNSDRFRIIKSRHSFHTEAQRKS